jgi:hypothetical protein
MTKAHSRWVRSCACGISVLLMLAVCPVSTQAALLRGRLVRIGPNGEQYPAPGITVTVFRQDIGRSAPSVTDAGGMYYQNNIPAGSYWLEVWVSNPPRAYQVQVGEPGTDIPPIVI